MAPFSSEGSGYNQGHPYDMHSAVEYHTYIYIYYNILSEPHELQLDLPP